MYPPNAHTLVLRLDENPPPEFAGIVRQVIHKCDPRLIASEVASIDESIGNSIPSERFALRILKILSGIALGLAMVGLFSVIAFAVESRMREFGVRLALGATPGDLRQLVLRRSLTTAAFGVTAGVGAALGLTRFMQSLLFETTPNDPVVYLAVAALLLVAAALACWLPAWRAAKVDPVVALRSE